MKSINVLSLVQAHNTLSTSEFENFTKYYSIAIKNDEIHDLKRLTSEIHKTLPFVNVLNNFYVGYKIQHISKEFDLLRFGSNYIINIELKNDSTEDKITKQLIQNSYYLSHVNRVIHNFCYVASTNTLYKLNSAGELVTVNINFLIQLLTHQDLLKIGSPDSLFNPSEYLVSPFNSTDKFVDGKYFLTNQQEYFKNKILLKLNINPIAFIALTGGPGTGKTLLTYDIIKSIKNIKRTLIVHCGQLNEGHHKLIKLGWNIIAVKHLRSCGLNGFDVVVVDETQRIYPSLFEQLIIDAKEANTSCIFSYDKQQTLSAAETRSDIEGKINAISGIDKFTLSDKIRTNKEIAGFIKVLFNNKRNNVILSNCGNIDFEFFSNLANVENYIELLSSDGWEVLKLTPSQYNKEYHVSYSHPSSKTSHNVIGQEFDNVAVVVDEFFSYDANGLLTYNSTTYYDSVKMLFQNITRTRKRLKLIIIRNTQVLNRCLSVLS